MLSFRETDNGLIFKVFVQPKSSKNAVAGLYGDALKIRITAPPVDNAANKLCCEFIAKSLKMPKSAVEIVSGKANRNKQVLVKFREEHPKKSDVEKMKQSIAALTGNTD